MTKDEIESFYILDQFLSVLESLSIIEEVRIFTDEWYLFKKSIISYEDKEV